MSSKIIIDNKTMKILYDFDEYLDKYYEKMQNIQVLIFEENIAGGENSRFNREIILPLDLTDILFCHGTWEF